MKLLVLIFSLIGTAFADVDLSAKYHCVVTESNRSSLPVGAQSRFPTSFADVTRTGMLPLDHGSIFLYSKLETFMSAEGKTVFAVDPSAPKETQGSIFVDEVEDELHLDVTLFKTTRVFNPENGWPVFLIKESAEKYKLVCSKLL